MASSRRTPQNRGSDAGSRKDSPLIDDAYLEGPPPTAWRDFRNTKLRQFSRRERQIKWLRFLGHGIQGAAFKVSIGGEEPVVLKIFWDAVRPTSAPFLRPDHGRLLQWPLMNECRTVSLLEKMRHAMACVDEDSSQRILINYGPQTVQGALMNIRVFSNESRRTESPVNSRAVEDSTLSPPPPFPPLPRCYGWTKLAANEIKLLPPWLSRDLHPDEVGNAFGIIYEYIPPEVQDLDIGQIHLNFFHAVGFVVHPYKQDNWHGGRLVDISDVWSVFSRDWDGRSIRKRDANEWFWTRDYRKNAMPTTMVVRPDLTKKLQEMAARIPKSESSDDSDDEESE